MLAKQYRLPSKISFAKSYNYSTSWALMKVITSFHQHPRFGFVVTKKIAKNATKRNYIKRKVRAQFEHLLPEFIEGIDILIIIKKDVTSLSSSLLSQEIVALCRKNHLFRQSHGNMV